MIAGTLYAPNATLYFSNNATVTQVTAVIAKAVDFNNNAGANFGPAPKALAISALVLPPWDLNQPNYGQRSGAVHGHRRIRHV